MTTSKPKVKAKAKENEIALHRIYDAPVRLVWDAWTDPKKAAHWWGPRGFTTTTKSKDFKVGGQWIYTMVGPDGTVYPNIATYHEIVEHKRMVYDHGATETTPPLFRVTVDFEEIDGKTHMSMVMALESAAAAEQTKVFIKKAGGNSTWDRLAEYLDAKENGREVFVINRTFKASIDKLFDMWVKPEFFSRWLPPSGFSMEFLRKDIRVGGRSFFKMSNGGGVNFYGSILYTHISKPTHIAYDQDFRDENEKLSKHPGAPEWPEVMEIFVKFTEESEGETRVTLSCLPGKNSSAEEVRAFVAERPGMTGGWTGSFDKLEELISQS